MSLPPPKKMFTCMWNNYNHLKTSFTFRFLKNNSWSDLIIFFVLLLCSNFICLLATKIDQMKNQLESQESTSHKISNRLSESFHVLEERLVALEAAKMRISELEDYQTHLLTEVIIHMKKNVYLFIWFNNFFIVRTHFLSSG